MILLRHGQTVFNLHFGKNKFDPGIPDPALTEAGREQAANAANLLALKPISRIITSPYTRAIESALIVADRLGLDVQVDACVRELAGFSCDIGSSPNDLATRWPNLDFSSLLPNWWAFPGDPKNSGLDEPESNLFARVSEFRKRLAAESDWNETLVVCHWGTIRVMSGQLLKNGEFVKHDPRPTIKPPT